MAKKKTTYGLVEPFDCDEPLFALGVEWEQWRQKILNGTVRTDLCLEENAIRIERMLERHGYQAEAQPFPFKVKGRNCHQWWKVWVGRKPRESQCGEGTAESSA